MPGIKKPTAILNLNDSFKKNPNRKRGNEPTADPLGEPPKYFKAAQKKIWNEIKGKCAPGVLLESDFFAVECLTNLLHEYRDMPKIFQSAKMTQLQNFLKQLGMTPSSRASIVVPQKEEKDTTYDDM